MVDERLNNILSERDKALQESNNVYQGLLDNNQNLYNQQLDYLDKYETTQNEMAQSNYESTQNLINQQKEQAQKETDIENQKAYNSYLRMTKPGGVGVESLGGLNNSGYSETYKLGAYNAYQNRAGKANDALRKAITEYDNEMVEAKKTYNTTKAQNALAKLEMGLQYAQSFNDTNMNLNLDKLGNSQNLNSEYDNRYMNMVNQINTEKQLAEQIRQYNEQMAYQRERDRIADQQWQKQYQASLRSSGGSSGGSGNPSPLDEDDETNDYKVSSDVTPIGLSDKALKWLYNITNKSIKEGGILVSELENLLSSALKNGTITNSEADKILKSYGL